MELRHLANKTSQIRSHDQLRKYYDAELFLDFDQIDTAFVSLPFKELVSNEGSKSSLFRGNEIYSVHTFSNKDQFFLFNDQLKTHVQVSLSYLPALTNLDNVFIRPDFWQFRDRENISDDGAFPRNTSLVAMRSFYGRGLHLGRSPKAIQRVLRYWQIVKGLETQYKEPHKFVVPESRVPSFETIVPAVSFENFKQRGLVASYPFIFDPLHRSQMFADGVLPEPLVEEITEYTEVLKEQYFEKVTRPFSTLPDVFANIILDFIHKECDDCILKVAVSDLGVSIRRGIDHKMLPYFDKMFEEQDDATVVSIFS